MGRRRKGHHTQTRKTLIVLSSVIGCIALAIAGVSIWTFEGPPLMDLESPEIVAKRDAPANQYFAMMEVVPDLAQRPVDFYSRDEEANGFRGIYQPAYGSAGYLVDVNRRDDDQALIGYLAKSDAAVPRIKEALDSGYVMTPSIPRFADDIWSDEFTRLMHLGRDLAAIGLRYGEEGDWETAQDRFVIAMRLTTALGSDGPLYTYTRAAEIQFFVCSAYDGAVLKQAPVAEHGELLEAFRAASLHDVDLTMHLHYGWRMLDSDYAVTYLWQQSPEDIRGGDMGSRFFVSRFFNQTKDDVREWQEEFPALVNGSYSEFQEWRTQNKDDLDEYNWAVSTASNAVTYKAKLAAYLKGLEIARSLRAVAADTGRFPETLAKVEIDVADPFRANESYVYWPVGEDDYTLYSVGPDGADHQAYTGARRARDVIIHRAAVESAAEHQEFLDKF